jgi:hypothetical protein
MAKKELLIHISQEGQVSIEVEGVQGASCLDVTQDLEDSLGRVRERIKKPAFYETNAEEAAVTHDTARR